MLTSDEFGAQERAPPRWPILRLSARCFAARSRRCDQRIYKPGSVLARKPATIIPLGRRLPGASSNQPGRRGRFLPCGLHHVSPLFGLAPGGVYHAAPVTGGAVRSYRTLSPLPVPQDGRSALCGTFPGVAPAGRYPAPCLRGARTFLDTLGRAPRSSGRLAASV